VAQPYLDIYGGSEKVCHNVIKTLLAHGQDVQLLTLHFDAEKYRNIVGEEFPKQVNVHTLNKKVEVKPPFTIYKRHHALVQLLKEHRTHLKYDYLFSTQSSSPIEPLFLKNAKKNIAYVHFPEIHSEYNRSSLKKKVYLWLFKRWVEQCIGKLDLVFCNSNYTKEAIEHYWKGYGVKEPIVVYPPVNLEKLWCDTPLVKRAIYIGRFVPSKRHEIFKRLAADLPAYEFVSVGGLTETDKTWLNGFSSNIPENYKVKTNLPQAELTQMLQNSRMYVHLMEGEHFGIAPIEGVASGCVTLVHDSGGMKEFILEEFRWQTYNDLKEKIVQFMDSTEKWDAKRKLLWSKISHLNPETFQENIWLRIQKLME
jgi:glycosyltransferase involved in cell wall biosynthesis